MLYRSGHHIAISASTENIFAGIKTLDFAGSFLSLLREIIECLMLYSWLNADGSKKQVEVCKIATCRTDGFDKARESRVPYFTVIGEVNKYSL